MKHVWGPVVQWLVQRFRSERLRVRSRRSATFTPSAHVRRQSLPVWPPTLNNLKQGLPFTFSTAWTIVPNFIEIVSYRSFPSDNLILRARSNFRRRPSLCTVNAEIFVHDLISPESTKFSSMRKPCTYNSVRLMRHYPRSTKIYSAQKLANAGVRNFYAYKTFSEYNTTLHRNTIPV